VFRRGANRHARDDHPRTNHAPAQTTNANALLIVLGDQPFVTSQHLAALRDAWLAAAPVAASRFDGMLCAPAIFDRSRWPQLAQFVAVPFLMACVACDCVRPHPHERTRD
jgi:hypothetical protein